MAERRLTDFEHILLGMIYAESSSGYDLKRAFASTPMAVYRPSSGALYPALRRLEGRSLIRVRPPLPSIRVSHRPRRVYEPTVQGSAAHLAWVSTPIDPATVAADLGVHLMRFAMMERVLSRTDVLHFLHDLNAALKAFVCDLERYIDNARSEARHPQLALEHGIAIHRASLAWTEHAITRLTDSPENPSGPPPWSVRSSPTRRDDDLSAEQDQTDHRRRQRSE